MVVLAAVWVVGMAAQVSLYAAEKTETTKEDLQEGEKQEKEKTGRFRLTLSEAGKEDIRLAGGRFAVYEKTGGKKAGELVTGEDGSASIELAEGDYILKETAAPEGYLLSEESINVTVQRGEVWTLAFVNKKENVTDKEKETVSSRQEEKGTLQILNAGAGTGEKLSGGVFYVYDSKGTKVKETEVSEGKADLLLCEGDYYLKEVKAPDGYLVESARIWFHIQEGTVTVAEITSERHENYLAGRNPQEIFPKTGERLPVLRYILAAACFGVSAWCGLCLRQMKKRRGVCS